MIVVLSSTSDGEAILQIRPETDVEISLLRDFAANPIARRTTDVDTHIVIFSRERQKLPKEFTTHPQSGKER